MKKIIFLFVAICFWTAAQSQNPKLKYSKDSMSISTNKSFGFLSYVSTISSEQSRYEKGMAYDPSLERKQRIVFAGDSLLIFFLKEEPKPHIKDIKVINQSKAIKIKYYEKIILEADTAKSIYTIIGKDNKTTISTNFGKKKTIKLEAGEQYIIRIHNNALRADNQKSIEKEKGAYPPSKKKQKIWKA